MAWNSLGGGGREEGEGRKEEKKEGASMRHVTLCVEIYLPRTPQE
jgi:hypothetical protein